MKTGAAVVAALVFAAGVAAGGPPVELDGPAGVQLAGTLRQTTLAVAADYGVVTLDLAKVKTLDFGPADGPRRAVSATLTDKSHLTGTVPADAALEVETPTGVSRVTAGGVEQVRFPHPRDTSLVAVLVGLLTLTLMEVVLGVDNVIFLAIQAGKLPPAQQARGRYAGLGLALVTRVLLLLSLNFLLGLTRPLFTLPALPFFESMDARAVSWRDIILLAGGTFLIGKSTVEMRDKLETAKAEGEGRPLATKAANFAHVILTIAVIDIVFSLDSVVTAVGMVEDVRVMIGAMVVAMLVMLVFAGVIGRFVESRPTVKVLALAFLILIGVLLVAEGLGQHLDKGYIYFAMAFAVAVEVVNAQFRGKPAAPPPAAGPTV